MDIGTNTPVVVTGGASGLGEAVARHLAARGAPVAIIDRDQGAGTAVAADIGGQFLQADITDAQSVDDALKQARQSQGQERICVNCAGIAPSAKTVSRGAAHDPDLFAKVISVNLIGTFHVSSQSAAGMAAADPLNGDGERGIIVNTASIAAYEGQIGQAAYAASKAGIVGLTLPMARDLARDGVRVMAIAPGVFGTPMVTAFPDEVQDALARNIPFPSRLGAPEEFARLVRHTIENTMLNGETIRIDGATRMQPR